MDTIARLLLDQDGVVARRQCIAAGVTPVWLERSLRRGELVPVHPGVYVEHNGPLTWMQRAWAGVLHAWPAALCLDSALRAHDGPGRSSTDERTIHVAVDRRRHVSDRPGVTVHRMSDLQDRVMWHRSPPRTRYEDTVIDLAERASRVDAVARLADACGGRGTTAERLGDSLAKRKRVSQRAWLAAVLADVADGTCSVLEHGYLDLVERPHGLPRGTRQALHVTASGRVIRDVELAGLGLVIELDGRLFHSSRRARDRDLERDLDLAAERAGTTIRLGFDQVHGHPCRTAAKVARVMQHHGWTGTPTACASCGQNSATGRISTTG